MPRGRIALGPHGVVKAQFRANFMPSERQRQAFFVIPVHRAAKAKTPQSHWLKGVQAK